MLRRPTFVAKETRFDRIVIELRPVNGMSIDGSDVAVPGT